MLKKRIQNGNFFGWILQRYNVYILNQWRSLYVLLNYLYDTLDDTLKTQTKKLSASLDLLLPGLLEDSLFSLILALEWSSAFISSKVVVVLVVVEVFGFSSLEILKLLIGVVLLEFSALTEP